MSINKLRHASAICAPPDDAASGTAAELPMLTVTGVLGWLALTQGVAALGWALQLPLLPWAAAAAFALVAAGLLYRRAGRALAACTILLAVALAFSATVTDFSYDGQDYHLDAVYALADGWNPFHQAHSSGASALWLSHYSKGAWILGASLAALSGYTELGASQTVLLIACSALLTYYVLRVLRGCDQRLAVLLAALVALNPVNSVQLYTNYVDAQVGSLALILALLLYCYSAGLRLAAPALVACIVLLLNVKLSCALFIAVLCAVWLGWLIWRGPAGHWWRLLRLLAVAATAALLVGYNPFYTNLRDHGHPMYPLAGDGAISLLDNFAAPAFLKHNPLHKLALSIASESHHDFSASGAGGGLPRLKLPMTLSRAELMVFYRINGPLMGGFGFFFSAACLLLLGLGAAKLTLWLRAGPRRVDGPACVLVLSLLLSVLAFPASWWARYAPQLWSCAVLATGLLLTYRRERHAALGYAALTVLLLNAGLILAAASAHQIQQERDWRAQLARLHAHAAPLAVKLRFQSALRRLQAHHLTVLPAAQLPCAHPQQLIGGGAQFCAAETPAHSQTD